MTLSSLFPGKMSAASSTTDGRASIASVIAARVWRAISSCRHVNCFATPGKPRELDSDVVALVHEVGHVFGAEHVDDFNSIMHENFDYRSEFDAKNRKIIQNNRSCPFAK